MPHQPIQAIALDEHRGTAWPGASSTQPTLLNPRDKRSLTSFTKQEWSRKRIRNVSPARRPAQYMISLPACFLAAELPKDPHLPGHGSGRKGIEPSDALVPPEVRV